MSDTAPAKERGGREQEMLKGSPGGSRELGWEDIGAFLESAAALVAQAAEEAAALVGDVRDDPKRNTLDPRRSQLKAAQFASGLNYSARELERRAVLLNNRGREG